MRKILILLLGVTLLPVSCREESWHRDMSDAARAVLDRVVGIYVIEDIGWDGPEVDIDNDGVAGRDLMSQLPSVPFTGTREMEAKADMQTGSGYAGVVSFRICANRTSSWSRYYWSDFWLNIHFDVYGGEFEPDMNYFHWGYNEVIFENPSLVLTGDDRLVLGADTGVYDYMTESVVNGRISWKFRCVSGKGKSDKTD
ncbi:MAG: hypothetical protein ACI3ZT_03705 [Candidatus Cryptobacteroides sp.]